MGSPVISEGQESVPKAWKPWFMEKRTLIGPIKHWCNVLKSLHGNMSSTLHSARVCNPLDAWKTYGNGLWWAFDMLAMEETLETGLILDIPHDKLYLFYSCSLCIKTLCLYHVLQIRFEFTPGWIISLSVIGTKWFSKSHTALPQLKATGLTATATVTVLLCLRGYRSLRGLQPDFLSLYWITHSGIPMSCPWVEFPPSRTCWITWNIVDSSHHPLNYLLRGC